MQATQWPLGVGYGKPLYVLAFDHRESLEAGLYGWHEPLGSEETARLTADKEVIYDAFKVAMTRGGLQDRAAILVDEQFGAAILADARRRGYLTAMPVEMSGAAEFEFEHGADYARHLDACRPTFCKALVRFNPDGDGAANWRQAARLRQLSDDVHRSGRRFLLELLVPPLPKQLQRLGRNRCDYERELRPVLQGAAIHALQEAGVEPDVWAIEGIDRRADGVAVADVARRDGRDAVGCLILGRGTGEARLRAWLGEGAGVPGITGFAVGRTAFWEPLLELREFRIDRQEAVARISANYQLWIERFEQATLPASAVHA